MKIKELIKKAIDITGKYKPSLDCTAGSVGAALITKKGNIYTGICIDVCCGMGFCAEHSAIAEMLKNHESEIEMIVAVNTRNEIFWPCGRCRELMYQVNPKNKETKVIINDNKTVTLNKLLPKAMTKRERAN